MGQRFRTTTAKPGLPGSGVSRCNFLPLPASASATFAGFLRRHVGQDGSFVWVRSPVFRCCRLRPFGFAVSLGKSEHVGAPPCAASATGSRAQGGVPECVLVLLTPHRCVCGSLTSLGTALGAVLCCERHGFRECQWLRGLCGIWCAAARAAAVRYLRPRLECLGRHSHRRLCAAEVGIS